MACNAGRVRNAGRPICRQHWCAKERAGVATIPRERARRLVAHLRVTKEFYAKNQRGNGSAMFLGGDAQERGTNFISSAPNRQRRTVLLSPDRPLYPNHDPAGRGRFPRLQKLSQARPLPEARSTADAPARWYRYGRPHAKSGKAESLCCA